jgi:hypothetical protein
MRRTKLLLLLVTAMLLLSAFGLSALGLDVELKGGGGMAMGTTDDPDKTGKLRYALGAGLGLDLFLFEPGSMAFGVTAGAGYANLNYHGIWENYPAQPFAPPATTTQNSDSAYNYLLFPFGLVGKFAMGARSLTVRGGGFVGYFLGGTTDLDYETESALNGWVSGEFDLDDSNTDLLMYGLSFYAGLDVFSRGKLSITPSLEFNLGLSDTTVDQEIAPSVIYPPASKDTFWALTANVGIRYSILQ